MFLLKQNTNLVFGMIYGILGEINVMSRETILISDLIDELFDF